MCRKWTGHYLVSIDSLRPVLSIESEENFSWYQSAEKVRVGLGKTCGQVVFFDLVGVVDLIGLAMGAFDASKSVKIGIHIYVHHKRNHYEITDGLSRNQI